MSIIFFSVHKLTVTSKKLMIFRFFCGYFQAKIFTKGLNNICANPSSWYRLLFLTPCFLPRIDISRLTHSQLLDHHNFSRLYQIMIPVIVFSQGLSRENNQDLWRENWFEVGVEWYLYKAWCEIKIVYGSKLNLKATSPWTFL